jgi:hypothetical protein
LDRDRACGEAVQQQAPPSKLGRRAGCRPGADHALLGDQRHHQQLVGGHLVTQRAPAS